MYSKIKLLLEDINERRDQLLFPLLKKYWPRWILPNHLTGLRIVLGILLICLLVAGFASVGWLLTIFLVASLLDLFDGSVARALNKKTELGAMLDPIADRVLIVPVAIYVLFTYHLWLLIALLVPEVFSGILSLYSKKKRIKIRPNIFGKTKMVIECVAFAMIIFFDFPNQPSQAPIILLWIGFAFLIVDLIIKVNFIRNAKAV